MSASAAGLPVSSGFADAITSGLTFSYKPPCTQFSSEDLVTYGSLPVAGMLCYCTCLFGTPGSMHRVVRNGTVYSQVDVYMSR